MASLTDTLAASNAAPIEDIDIAGKLKSGMEAGIGLATAKEQIEEKKMKVADQRLELKTKQSTALMNRMTMALYAPNSKIGNSAVDSIQSWADQSQITFNGEGIKHMLSDPKLKLSAQKNMTKLRSGGVLNEKQMEELMAFVSSDTPEMANILLNYNAANAQTKNKEDFEMRKQDDQQASSEKIAAMGIDKINAREDKEINKEKRKEEKQLDADYFSVEKTLSNLKEIKAELQNYSKSSKTGTGPIATAGGLSKYFSQDTEGLNSKMKTVSLESMVKMFSGMSKAVDTNAERAAFEATQPSITLDDQTNFDVLEKQIAAAESMKRKILNAKKGIGAIEDSQTQASAPPNAAKAQAALERARAKAKNVKK